MGVGPLEIGILLVIALLIVGSKRLPSLGRSAGTGLREAGSGLRGLKEGITSRHDRLDAEAEGEGEESSRRSESG